MDNGGVATQVVKEIKNLGEETGKQLSKAGEQVVKGTVEELFGGNVQVTGEEQVPVMSEVEEFKQRKEAENVVGLKRVRSQLENYRQWQKQLKEELKDEGKIKEEQVKVTKKEEKKNVVKDFWGKLISRNRSKYAGTGEVVKAHN